MHIAQHSTVTHYAERSSSPICHVIGIVGFTNFVFNGYAVPASVKSTTESPTIYTHLGVVVSIRYADHSGDGDIFRQLEILSVIRLTTVYLVS